MSAAASGAKAAHETNRVLCFDALRGAELYWVARDMVDFVAGAAEGCRRTAHRA